MSTAVVRTSEGWWVQRADSRVHPVETDAGTTAELLADRPAVERADRPEGDWEELGSRELLSPVTSPCRWSPRW